MNSDDHYRLVVDGGCIARRRNAVSLHFFTLQNAFCRGFLFATKAIAHFVCTLSPLLCAKQTRGIMRAGHAAGHSGWLQAFGGVPAANAHCSS